MNTKQSLLILLIVLYSGKTDAQANVNISFSKIIFFDDFRLLQSTNGTLYEPWIRKRDSVLEISEYNDDIPEKEIVSLIDGINSFQKQYIGTDSPDELIKALKKKKQCILCIEEDEFGAENPEWYTLDEDEVFRPLTVNNTYQFLIGNYGLVFRYKDEIIFLYDGEFCQLSEINCDFEEKGKIEFGKLHLEKIAMEGIDLIEPKMDRYPIFYSKDSIYYYGRNPDFEMSVNNEYAKFEKTALRGAIPKKSIAAEGNQLIKKEQFLKELQQQSFCLERETINECVQHFTKNIFVRYRIVYEDETKTRIKYTKIDQVFPIYMDDSATSFTFGIGRGFLFLKTSDRYMVNDGFRNFQMINNEPLNEEIITEIKLREHHFKSVETQTGYGLRDLHSEMFYIPPVYDSISVLGNFIVARQKEQIYFFDKYFKKIDLDYTKVRDYYFTNNNLQVLYGNELLWLDQKEGNLLKEFTAYKPEVVYADDSPGFRPVYKYHINQTETDFFTLEGIAEDNSVYPPKELKKEILIVERNRFDSLHFLTRSEDESVILQRYDRFFPKGMTYIFSKKNKKGLFARITDDLNVHQKDSILITGVDEFFPKSGILEPIKFRIKNKFGFYPCSQNANYFMLGDFNYGFARFKNGEGKEGWINLNGQEFFDE